MHEGLGAVAAAEDPGGDPVDVNELMDLLEGCSKLGELGAAVYCAERLESLHKDGSDIKLPDEVIDRAFTALKPFLRPNASTQVPSLHGPWSKPPPGRAGMPNHRKGLGQILNRLAVARKERELAQGGEEVQRKRAIDATKEQKLHTFSQALGAFLADDSKAVALRRRGVLGEAMVRICGEHGITVSTALAWVIIGELETLGVVRIQGRELIFDKEVAKEVGREYKQAHDSLHSFKPDLDMLETLAKERSERRKKRQKARAQGRVAKRRRLEDE